jgi:hypothetical protein
MAAADEVVTDVDGHAWRTRSSHPSSEGVVSYQQCHCGVWRVLLGPDRVLAGTNDRSEITRRPCPHHGRQPIEPDRPDPLAASVSTRSVLATPRR